jgi:hypothetical protein
MNASRHVAASSAAGDFSLFGCNELALHHKHLIYRPSSGMPLPFRGEAVR